jgi:hypothetical protein
MPAEARETLRLWLTTGRAPSAGTVEDATALVEAARAQGLAGLLHSAVEGQALPWPDPARERLRELHHALLARGVAHLDLARRAYGIVARAGGRSLPLKGAAIAESGYDSPGDRPMSDVDLLTLGAWDRALEALRAEGFQEIEAADHAWALRDPASGGVLELHHSVCSCPGFYPMDPEGLWERSRPATGQVPRLPSDEDLLVHLALHAAFQHGLVLSLVQYLDFRRLLERGRLDPDRLRLRVAQSRAEAPLALALLAASAVVGAPIGRDLGESLGAWLPGGLVPWLSEIAASPLAVVIPAAAPLFRVRWELARSRRADWLRRTLAPAHPGDRRAAPWPLRAAVRGLTLAVRWGPQAWRPRRRLEP